MFRYVAMVWDPSNAAATEAARDIGRRLDRVTRGWAIGLSSDGMEVRHTLPTPGNGAHRLGRTLGVVVGTLFYRSTTGRSSRASSFLAEDETDAIVSSGARYLVTRYWGRYVAFLRDPSTPTTWILRDPSGAMPCFSAEYAGVSLYFSFLDDYLDLQVSPGGLSVNWDCLAQYLCQPAGPRARATCLTDVTQILPGECVEWQEGRSTRRLHWNPAGVAGNVIEDPQHAATLLRDTTLDAVHAWASCHESILHAIGGLDSSIAAACLALAPTKPRILCFNFYSPGPRSDERAFAAQMVKQAGLELITVPRNPTLSLKPLLNVRKTPYPASYLYFLESSPVESLWASRIAATAISSGFGGDQLFGQRAPFATADYALRRGFSLRLFAVAYDQARRERDSIWRILGNAIAQRWSTQASDFNTSVGAYRNLLRPEIIESVKKGGLTMSPILMQTIQTADRSLIGRGKLDHIQGLLSAPPYDNPLGSNQEPEQLALLYCQPIMEVCLRIPTDVLTDRGYDRAIARRAFRDDLPRSVINRRSKGTFALHTKQVLLNNLSFARDMLLGGHLVKQGLVDGKALDRELRVSPIGTRTNSAEIHDCIYAEVMIRRWLEGAGDKSTATSADLRGTA